LEAWEYEDDEDEYEEDEDGYDEDEDEYEEDEDGYISDDAISLSLVSWIQQLPNIKPSIHIPRCCPSV